MPIEPLTAERRRQQTREYLLHAAAQVFAAEGAHVFGSDMNTAEQVRTEELVREAGGTIASLAPVDLSTEDGAEAWAAAAVSERIASDKDNTPAHWNVRMMDLNGRGCFLEHSDLF